MSHQFTDNTGALNYVDRTATIGHGTSIWHWAVVLADVIIGDNCSIGSHAEIGRGTIIGENTRVGAFVFLPPNSKVGKNVFIAPHVMFCDDKHPRAGNAEYIAQPPTILDGASVGAGSVVLPGVTIGRKAMVGAGSIVTRDVPDGAVVRGEPARLRHMTNFDIYAAVMGEHGQLKRDDLMDRLEV